MKSFALAFLLIGTIIGAGFASGREILTFFGKDSALYVAPLCGVLIFLCSVLFLAVGQRARADNISCVNIKVMGKAHYAADIFLLFNSLVSLGGMLAGMDSLFGILLPIAPLYSLISGILCALIVVNGLNGLLKGNSIIVPIIIVLIMLICLLSIDSMSSWFSFNTISIPAAFVYVSSNMMLASTVFTTIHGIKKRQIIAASLIASVVIAALVLFIILALNSTQMDGAMPLMQMAQQKGRALFYVSFITVGISIFTTMMTAMMGLNSWLKPIVKSGRFSIVIVLIAGLIVSNFGFENVIGYLYPLIGILGMIYIVFCIKYLIKSKKNNDV